MSSPFRWRLWRVAWARGSFTAISGRVAWRRIWWRLWWRPQPGDGALAAASAEARGEGGCVPPEP